MKIVKSGNAYQMIITASELKGMMSIEDMEKYAAIGGFLQGLGRGIGRNLKNVFKGVVDEAKMGSIVTDFNNMAKQIDSLTGKAAKYQQGAKSQEEQNFFRYLSQLMMQVRVTWNNVVQELGLGGQPAPQQQQKQQEQEQAPESAIGADSTKVAPGTPAGASAGEATMTAEQAIQAINEGKVKDFVTSDIPKSLKTDPNVTKAWRAYQEKMKNSVGFPGKAMDTSRASMNDYIATYTKLLREKKTDMNRIKADLQSKGATEEVINSIINGVNNAMKAPVGRVASIKELNMRLSVSLEKIAKKS